MRANWHRFDEDNQKTEKMLQRKLGANAQELNVVSRQKLIDEFRQKYPAEVSPRHMRQVLRAHSIASYGGSIEDPAGQQRVLQYTVQMDGRTMSLDDIVERYNPIEWADRALTEADLPVVDSLRYLAQANDQRDGYETGEPLVSPY
ncbi:hypothetical protein FM104_12535 [Microbacterium esteraromaticum]|uniref:Uncharacterized protein n=1 Tax=Microbacterium esteraromaticum TaxID=57043 RepID=A0A1R4KG33_9MICO|nr:hypothetical protein FM104_12535 [Microbacterium esteraromaticum]